MAISRPRTVRIRRPLGWRAARSIGCPLAHSSVLPCRITWPATMRPGFGTMLRMERAVTLLPLPLSPTTQSVLPRRRVKLTWSTALTVSWRVSNQVLRSFTSSTMSPSVPVMANLLPVGIGGIAQTSAHEIEGKHRRDNGNAGGEKPGSRGDRANVLRLLQQNTPAHHGRLKTEPEKAQRRFRQDHARNGEAHLGNDMADEGGRHVAEDDARFTSAIQAGGSDEILGAQRQEATAHDPGQARPADQRQYDGDAEIDPERRPVGGHGSREAKPQRRRRQRQDKLDRALDDVVDPAAVIAREAAEDDAENEAQGHPDQ